MMTFVCDRCGTPVEIPFHPIQGPALDKKTAKSMGCAMSLPVPDGESFKFQQSHLCMTCLLDLACWMKNYFRPQKRCCKRHPGKGASV